MTPAGAPGDAIAARVAWSAIAEPLDPAAALVVSALGHVEALAWLEDAARRPAAAVAELRATPEGSRRLAEGIERWARRRERVDPERLVAVGRRVGARVVAPGVPEWPAALDVLGVGAPHVLWVRGEADLGAAWTPSVAVVGARACTSYGEHVALDLAGSLADRGLTVISGGAYGIDAAAHRGALGAGGATVAVLAGGVDRLYPAGNADLLERVMRAGAVVSESPPGFAPHRSRFLSRNRLIAAAGTTVVVEAAARSGALSTARHAAELARPVAAVPGPVTSAASAGCHELVRAGLATLVTRAADVLELALPLGEQQPALPVSEAADPRPDFRTPAERQAYDALSARGAVLDAIAPRAGLSAAEALGALGALEMRGIVHRDGARWRRAWRPPADKT